MGTDEMIDVPPNAKWKVKMLASFLSEEGFESLSHRLHPRSIHEGFEGTEHSKGKPTQPIATNIVREVEEGGLISQQMGNFLFLHFSGLCCSSRVGKDRDDQNSSLTTGLCEHAAAGEDDIVDMGGDENRVIILGHPHEINLKVPL